VHSLSYHIMVVYSQQLSWGEISYGVLLDRSGFLGTKRFFRSLESALIFLDHKKTLIPAALVFSVCL